jgi:TPP-dependent pyruvate/acetoin dehydrogenase alpha subunit
MASAELLNNAHLILAAGHDTTASQLALLRRSVGSIGEPGVVGAGMPLAVGAGLGAKLRRSGQVALSFSSVTAVRTPDRSTSP